MISDQQYAAYEECCKLAAEKKWLATHTALVEDGPGGGVDWIKILASWKEEKQ